MKSINPKMKFCQVASFVFSGSEIVRPLRILSKIGHTNRTTTVQESIIGKK
jgi:hypothetical protein